MEAVPAEEGGVYVGQEQGGVLLLIPSLGGGGAENVFVTLLRHFDRSRYRYGIAVVNSRESVYHGDIPPDVDFFDLKCSRLLYALPKMIRLIWTYRPQVVLSTVSHLNLGLALIKPLLPRGTRCIARETAIVSEALKKNGNSLWRWGYCRFYRRFHLIICQSQSMLDDLAINFHVPTDKVTRIYNPIDLDYVRALSRQAPSPAFQEWRQGFGRETILLAAAGRLVWVKGFDILIQAVALVADPRFKLVLLGTGPLRRALEEQAHAQGVAGRIFFAGYQRNPYPYFAAARALMISSRYEGFPNVALEALACGTQVIASPSLGSVREIAALVRGCTLAESPDAGGLAKAMVSLVQPGEITQMDLKQFSVDNVVKQYSSTFTGA